MLLSWFSRLLAGLLVSLLFIATIGFTVNQTVLNTSYIDGQFKKVDAYTKLSNGIVDQVVKNTGTTNIPAGQLAAKLHSIITPAVVEQRLNGTLGQISSYYKQGGAVPTLDVSDLVSQAQAAGVPVQAGNFAKPIQLNAVTDTKKVSDQLHAAQIGLIGALILLAVTIVAIAIYKRNYIPLANIFISLGLSVAASGVLGYILVSKLSNHLAINSTNNTFVGLGRDLVKNIGQDLSKRFAITGIIILVVGIITRLLLGRLNTQPKQAKASSKPKDTATPSTKSDWADKIAPGDAPAIKQKNQKPPRPPMVMG